MREMQGHGEGKGAGGGARTDDHALHFHTYRHTLLATPPMHTAHMPPPTLAPLGEEGVLRSASNQDDSSSVYSVHLEGERGV